MARSRIDYLSRDYEGIRTSLLDYAATAFPDWQPASEGDLGLMIVELFSYMGDILSYYTDRAQFENFLSTATQRESVLGIAYLLGYLPSPGSPASGTVTLDTSANSVFVPAGTKIKTGRVEALDGPVTFETIGDATVYGGVEIALEVPVHEGTTVNYLKVGESTGLPNQEFLLPNTGVYTDTIRVFIEDYNGSTVFMQGTKEIQTREWVRVEHLLDAEATSAVFEAVLDKDNTVSILLGDDINGAIPPTGLQIFVTYRYGYGLSGNVTAGQVFLIDSKDLRAVRVAQDSVTLDYLSSAMTGGADPESTDSIRYNAPRAYRTQQRAINEQDFLDLALGVEGVTKANLIVGSFTSVTVYITGPDGGPPTQALKDLVAAKFLDKTLVGVDVVIATPTFIPINFGTVADPVHISLYDQYSQAAVKAGVTAAIRTFISSMPYGRRLTVGNVYDAISTVDGVEYVEIPVMARNDSAQVGTANITPRAWEVFSAGTFNLYATGGVA